MRRRAGRSPACSSARSSSTPPGTTSRTGTPAHCSAPCRAIYPVGVADELFARGRIDQSELIDLVTEDAIRQYDAREAEFGEELMRALERFLLLQIIDERWREHLHDMDYLREGIHLRGFAQIEPLVAYKNEAFTLFEDLMNSVWADFARLVFHVQVAQEGVGEGGPGAQAPRQRSYQPAGSSTGGASRVSYSSGVAAGAGALAAAATGEAASENGHDAYDEPPQPAYVEQRRVSTDEQLGRNDPCWCGSGKKFKRCHGA